MYIYLDVIMEKVDVRSYLEPIEMDGKSLDLELEGNSFTTLT